MIDERVHSVSLGKRFRAALVFAARAHEGQGRKGTRIPYIAHLLAVTAIVLEYGGDEDQAIAALLHDAIEDQGGDAMRREIRREFGDRVTGMVDDCTDAEVQPKPPWKERKLAYLAHIPAAHPDSLLVSMADKLHNAGAIVRDLRIEGPTVFDRFNAGPEETVWYYRSLMEAFDERRFDANAEALRESLRGAVEKLAEAVALATRGESVHGSG